MVRLEMLSEFSQYFLPLTSFLFVFFSEKKNHYIAVYTVNQQPDSCCEIDNYNQGSENIHWVFILGLFQEPLFIYLFIYDKNVFT